MNWFNARLLKYLIAAALLPPPHFNLSKYTKNNNSDSKYSK